MKFSVTNNWIEMPPETRSAIKHMGPFSRHALYLQCCQKIFQAETNVTPDPKSEILRSGFGTYSGILDDQSVRKFRDLIDESLSRDGREFRPSSEDPAYLVQWRDEDKHTAAQLLRSAFSGRLESLLHQYFGSHFLIRSVTASRLFPSNQSTQSYLWHRDAEVPHQVHVIFYLTDLSDEHGSTELLPLAETKTAAAAGYDFPLTSHRKSDLSGEFNKMGRPFKPHRVDAKAGDALVFTPNRILHKGSQPIKNYRDTVLAVVHPCPSSWQLALQHNYPHVFSTRHFLNVATNPFDRFQPVFDQKDIPRWVREFKFMPDDWGDGATE